MLLLGDRHLLERQHVRLPLGDSGGQQFFGEPGGYAEPRRGILSIGDHQIRLLARDNVFQAFEYDSPAGRTYNVPNKQNAHGFNRWKERSASPCGARS